MEVRQDSCRDLTRGQYISENRESRNSHSRALSLSILWSADQTNIDEGKMKWWVDDQKF